MRPKPRRRWLLAAIAVAPFAAMGLLAYFASAAKRDTAPLARPAVNAPFVRTPEDVVDQMLKLAEPRPDDLLYDLGCGDGRIVVRAAEKYGCRAVGFDIDPDRVQEARENARRQGVDDRVKIVEQDVLTLDLAEADVVTLYLLPRLNEKLLPQLRRLKPGARVVSHDFGLPGVVPDKTVEFTNPDGERTRVLYLWIAPLAADK
jgi:SAM-dependent methyltransferase